MLFPPDGLDAGGGIAPIGGGGIELPVWRRESSAWFNALAELFPCTFGKRLG
jgi:hypothetical protein